MMPSKTKTPTPAGRPGKGVGKTERHYDYTKIDAAELKKNIPVEQFYREALGEPKRRMAKEDVYFCCFHDDKNTPNLHVSKDGRFNCFTCKESGDIIKFHMKRCGVEFLEAVQDLARKYAPYLLNGHNRNGHNGKKIVAEYEYKNEAGNLVFQVVRFEPKDFRQRRPDGNGGWIWNLQGVETTLYNLHELVKTTDPIYITEGEKDADRLGKEGLMATTASGGAGKWRTEFDRYLQGRDIVVLADNDEPGRKHAEEIARSLHGIALSLKTVSFPELPEHGDLSDFLETHTLEELLQKIEQTPFHSPADTEETGVEEISNTLEAWEEPILFGEIETPEIPTDHLPSWLGKYAEAVRLNTQTPSGMAVMMALSVAATCLQKKFEVSPYDDYTEPLSIWTVTALPPATRKTAVVNALTSPLTEWENEEAKKLKSVIAENESCRAVNLKAIDRLQADAAKAKDSTERSSLIHEMTKLKLEMPEEIRPPRLWTSDSTPERLQGLLAEHGERMAVISDEGGIFEIMAGLYNDGRANIDIFLQSHAGRAVRVDRGSRSVCLNKPAFTFGLAVQPEIIKSLSQGDKRRFRGNGTLARFLYCLPKSNIGTRDVARRVSIPETVKKNYNAGILHLLNIAPMKDKTGKEIPRTLLLDSSALNAWLKFSQYIEANQGEGGKFEAFQDWSGKLPGAALRIAGICHVVEFGEKVYAINQATMERALDLAELLIKHAESAFDLMGADQAIDDAKFVLRWIQSQSRNERFFKRNDCHKALHGRFKKVDRLIKALSILKERNIITGPETLKTKKPTIVHYINPAILKGGMQ